MKKLLLFLCAVSILMCACKSSVPEPEPEPSTPTTTEPEPSTPTVTEGDMRQPKQMSFNSAGEQLQYRANEFTFNLTSLICKTPDKANIILSPMSASLMLGMVMNGADGETLEQMQKALGFEGLTQAEINDWYKNLIEMLTAADDVTTVKIANSLWVKNGFPVKPEYITVNQQYFHATADNVDMAVSSTADRINQWAADNTNDLIKKVVTPEDLMDCVMVLANALYFKSKWATPFEAMYTHKSDFDPLNGARIKPETMSGEFYTQYAKLSAGQLLEMDYRGGRFCMDVLLPEQGKDIRQVVADLTVEDWNTMLGQLSTRKVWVRFPKLKLKYNRTLTDDLKAAGMAKALSPAAEFPHVSAVPTYLSWVKQACYLAVDEEGTEAAAVTMGGYAESAMEPEPVEEFFVDRPFFLVLREKKQGNILFTAMITNPEAE